MVISYKYHIYPTSKQKAVLEHQFGLCRWLYHVALEHRITGYKAIGRSISYKEQQIELPSIKEQFPGFKCVHAQVLQNILRRIVGSFQNFFRRVKRGEILGFPRFKGKGRFDSICYPQSGFRLTGGNAISVNPYHTSQLCSDCGTLVKKEIHQRSHVCHVCGLSLHRDHNAAINILKSGTDAVIQMPSQFAAG